MAVKKNLIYEPRDEKRKGEKKEKKSGRGKKKNIYIFSPFQICSGKNLPLSL